jgi:hypothetical protein
LDSDTDDSERTGADGAGGSVGADSEDDRALTGERLPGAYDLMTEIAGWSLTVTLTAGV